VNRTRFAAWLSVAALAVVASVAGCSSEGRYRVLAFLFEDVPRPGQETRPAPVVRQPRHPAPPKPTPTPETVGAGQAGAGAALSTWDDAMRLLPKNQIGDPDWVAALAEKIIAPRPGIAADAAEQDVLALDVDLTPKSDPALRVTFSHQTHGGWLACPNCHTTLFEMKPGASPLAPDAAHGERACGACHGKVAFDIATGCLLCHLRNLPRDPNDRIDWDRAVAERLIGPRAGRDVKTMDQPTLDLDVPFTPKAQPALKSVFSHRTHTTWLACANCHPQLFPMQAQLDGLKPGESHSRRYCGACHGTVSFGMIGACGRCHPALQKARQHQEVLDLDIEVTPKSQPASRTVFSHKTHRWVECASCHTSLFETPAGASTMPPAEIYGGKYCAMCHGKVTADLIAQCRHCHTAGDAP